MEILFRCCDFPQNAEIIVPSFTFVASAHACVTAGLKVRFADCTTDTHCIDPSSVSKLVNKNTVAILGVNVWGMPCDNETLQKIAHKHKLKLFYDSAHAFACSGSHGKGERGRFGDAEVLSFHATKFFNSGEGGAIVTDDDEIAKQIRMYRNFAFADYDHVVGFGSNAKMSELHAALGLTNLKSINSVIDTNRVNYIAYLKGLSNIPGIDLLRYEEKCVRSNYQYIVVMVDPELYGLDRDQLVTMLHAENCLARKYFYPGVHRFEPYRKMDPQAESRVPNTIWISNRVMTLPTGTAVGVKEISVLCALLLEFHKSAKSIKSWFDKRHGVPALPRNPEGGVHVLENGSSR